MIMLFQTLTRKQYFDTGINTSIILKLSLTAFETHNVWSSQITVIQLQYTTLKGDRTRRSFGSYWNLEIWKPRRIWKACMIFVMKFRSLLKQHFKCKTQKPTLFNSNTQKLSWKNPKPASSSLITWRVMLKIICGNLSMN